MKIVAFVVTAAISASSSALAGDALTETLAEVQKASPVIATELKALANRSNVARAFLSSKDERPLNPMDKSHSRTFLICCALDCNGRRLHRAQAEFPSLCKTGELLATIRDQAGDHFVIFHLDERVMIGRFNHNADAFGTVTDEFDFHYDTSFHEFDTQLDPRGDVLLVRYPPLRRNEAKMLEIVTEYLIVVDGKLKRLKRVTEEYPIEDK